MDEVLESIKTIEAYIANQLSEIESKKTTSEKISKDLSDLESSYAKRKQEIEDLIAEIEKNKKAIEASIVPVEKEKSKLESDIGILVERKSELMLANSKLERDNRGFKSYEKVALAALEAKELELQSKEDQVNQKLGLQPKSRILPPR